MIQGTLEVSLKRGPNNILKGASLKKDLVRAWAAGSRVQGLGFRNACVQRDIGAS